MWNFNRFRLNSFIIILVFYLSTSVDSSLTEWPTDTEVMAGQTVRLNCSTSDIYSVNWEHIPTGRTSKNYVYLGGTVIVPYNERFSVEKTVGGSFALIISSVDLRDSGLYRCIDREGQGEQRQAQLTVIGSNPQCSSVEVVDENSCGIEKQDQAELYCDIPYSGNIAPSLTCPDLDVANIVKNEEKSNKTNIAYKLDIKSLPESIESNHSCHTSRSMIPSLPFKFTVSSVINSTQQLHLSEAGNVTCVANSTRPCSYTWMNESNDVISFDQTFEIKFPGTYQCTASCPIKGIPCDVNCLEVIYNSPGETFSNFYLALILISVASILVLVLVGTVVIVVYRRRKNKEKTHDVLGRSSYTKEPDEECHQEQMKQLLTLVLTENSKNSAVLSGS